MVLTFQVQYCSSFYNRFPRQLRKYGLIVKSPSFMYHWLRKLYYFNILSMADKALLLSKLNKALEWEYAAAVQYVQHAAVITNPEYDSISKELIIHSNEEMAHAVMVSEKITDLGGVPTVDVEKREVSTMPKAMLEQDLAGEELAISIYKELIGIAEELKEYGTRRVLEDILMQEEEHRRDLMNSLGK